jgi:P27 family predicted phage terminase small subunit
MGQKRKVLDFQKGNLTKETQGTRRNEQKSVMTDAKSLDRPPVFLINQVARNEWNRVMKEFRKMSSIPVDNLDRTALAGYCNAFAQWRRAQAEAAKAPLITKTSKGPKVNPTVDAEKKYADEVRKWQRLCGMTIDSRLKIAATKTAEVKDSVEEKFGGL